MDSQTLLMASIGIAVAALGLALAAHRRLSSARRSLAVLQGTFEGRTLIDAVAAYVSRVADLRDGTDRLLDRQNALAQSLSRSSRNVGMVRYDAFDDMGGQMSFSLALLDDHGDGVVVTAINGRTEARVYAKRVDGGRSDHNLSPEEREAITEALDRRTRVR